MKKLLALSAIVLAAGCLSERRAISVSERIQERYPHLFSPDTVTVDSSRIVTMPLLDTFFIDGHRLDTAVVTALSDVIEELTIENASLRVQLKTTPNIETNSRTWQLTGEAKPDTVIRLQRVPVKQIITKYVKGAPCEVVKGAPWWYYVLFALGGALFTFLGLKREGVAGVVKGFLKV